MGKKIIIRIFGGTGNQLFQLAFGLYLSKLTQKKLFFDSSFFNSDFQNRNKHFEKRNKSFESINLNYDLYRGNLFINSILLNKYIRKLLRFFRIYILRFGSFYYILEKINLNEFSFKDNCSYYFDGYWQDINHLYDSEIFKLLRNVLTPSHLLPSLNEPQIPKISVHIRAPDLNSKKFYILPNVDYYYKSINFFKNLYNNNCLFLIFSNNNSWLNENFKFKGDNILYCSQIYNLNEIDELLLMSTSDNIIISNSSFSWWAAMFINNKNRIVLCPPIWQYGIDYKKIYPKDWIIIDSN